MLRTTLEQMTHPIVVRRRLPHPFAAARIYTSTEGGLRYLRPRMGNVDPILLGLAAELINPGDVIWDIGANVGLFTFAAAVAAGHSGYVLAVEPDSQLIALLHRSRTVNHTHAPVEVVPAAIADDQGFSRFNIAARNRSTNHLDGFRTSQTGGIRATRLVPITTLNWLATRFPAPNVVKIDVEEAEVKVLGAAENVLRSHPKIICEVAGKNSEAVASILSEHDYTLYDGDAPAQMRVPTLAAAANTLAV